MFTDTNHLQISNNLAVKRIACFIHLYGALRRVKVHSSKRDLCVNTEGGTYRGGDDKLALLANLHAVDALGKYKGTLKEGGSGME